MFSRKSRPKVQAQPETGHQLCGTSPYALRHFGHLEKRVGEVWHGSIAPESWWLLPMPIVTAQGTGVQVFLSDRVMRS